MLVSAKAVWGLSQPRGHTSPGAVDFVALAGTGHQPNVQHLLLCKVWRLSLTGASKDGLNLGGVFSSLLSAAPGVINGNRHPGTQGSRQPHLVLSHPHCEALHGLCSCLQAMPVASSNITAALTSF